MAKRISKRSPRSTKAKIVTVPTPAGSLSWEAAKENFAVWAISAMIAFATYNVHRLTESVSELNNKITTLVTTNTHHEYQLSQQLGKITKIEEVLRGNGERIAKLEVEVRLTPEKIKL